MPRARRRRGRGPPRGRRSPRSRSVAGDVRDPAVIDALFDGVGPATVFHAAAVIHPERAVRELFDVNVGGTQLVLDRARRVGATRFVHVSSNSPFGANASDDRDRFDEDSPFHSVHGVRPVEARSRTAGAAQLRARRPARPSSLRPPWFYGPFQPRAADAVLRRGPPGPLPARRRRARSGVRWCSPATSCRARCSPRRPTPRPGHAYWIADAEPYALRDILDDRARRARGRGARPSPSAGRSRIPRAGRGRRRAARRRSCRSAGRYVQAVHVLGELKDTIACDIARARKELGYEPTVALLEGMRTSVRWCLDQRLAALMGRSLLVTGGSGYFGTVLAARRTRARRSRAHLRPQPARSAMARRRVRRGRRPRPRRRCAPRATASTSCSTTSRRCRWRRTASCSTRSTSAAPRTCSWRRVMRASPRSCTRRRARCSGSPSTTR